MPFQPNYKNFEDVMKNIRPARLPIYEHIISANIMEIIMDDKFADLYTGDAKDINEYFRRYCDFFKTMTYDTVSFEVCISEILPGHGAINGGMAGPIQSRDDFEKYPWDDIPTLFWNNAGKYFDALIENMPDGMKAVGGIGNGVFEISEDLVGLEYLPFIQIDNPELYADLFNKIGDLMISIWKPFLDKYKDAFVACRFGDDLGFKSSLLTNPITIRENILPQYKKVIDIVHNAEKPFLWHSCGCIFEIMDDVIALGINAKHSNEDAIAPYSRWIKDYGDKIGLLGGFDMDFLCQKSPEEVFETVVESGKEFRKTANGYALGSGNSIPDYVPVDNYLAMIEAAQEIRERETGNP